MTSAVQIVQLACEAAHSPGKTQQATEFFNAILEDLGETYDFASARGLYSFNFNPGLTSNFGSGPYPLPIDYLRTSGSSGSTGVQKSVWWTLQGVPYPLVPIDLSEFDMQVMQAGIQSYPYLFATDMGSMPAGDRILMRHNCQTTLGSQTLTGTFNTTVNGFTTGLGVAGYGIAAGS